MKPRIELSTYGDGNEAVVVHVPGEPGGYPIEAIGGEEVLRRYRAFPLLLEACEKARDEFALLIDDNLTADPPRGVGEADGCLELLHAAIAKAKGA